MRVTHPDKPYFSKQTKLSKLDIVRCCLSVAPGSRRPGERGLPVRAFLDHKHWLAFRIPLDSDVTSGPMMKKCSDIRPRRFPHFPA